MKILCQSLKDLVKGGRSLVFVTFLAFERLSHDFLTIFLYRFLVVFLIVLIAKSREFFLNGHFSFSFLFLNSFLQGGNQGIQMLPFAS
ncbi:Uncharacterised protein [Streptococcus pneumoniae]|nr:Uncharacterised protein [Streptococcus pneumoniae]